MKILLIITFAILNSLAPFSFGKSKQKLIWADEFNGESLDYSKWGVEENAYGGGNNEQQIYRWDKKNLRVENGNLVIEAHKDNPNIAGTTRPYSSARIRSKHRGDWKYCRVDVRAKMPIGKGMWPAIWMLPTDEKYGGWASSGEIDIMEQFANKTYVQATCHWDHNGGNANYGLPMNLSTPTEFHTYSIDWRQGSIKAYVDDVEYFVMSTDSTMPFDANFFLIFKSELR